MRSSCTPIHTGVTLGEPSGMRVARCAKLGRDSSARTFGSSDMGPLLYDYDIVRRPRRVPISGASPWLVRPSFRSRPLRVELPLLTFDVVCPRHGVTFDLSAEGKRRASLRAEHDVVSVHTALEPSRLVGPLEMAGDLAALLLQVNGLGVEFAVPVFRRDDPVSGNVDRLRSGQRFLGDGEPRSGQ